MRMEMHVSISWGGAHHLLNMFQWLSDSVHLKLCINHINLWLRHLVCCLGARTISTYNVASNADQLLMYDMSEPIIPRQMEQICRLLFSEMAVLSSLLPHLQKDFSSPRWVYYSDSIVQVITPQNLISEM